jgi:hypothetical protein
LKRYKMSHLPAKITRKRIAAAQRTKEKKPIITVHNFFYVDIFVLGMTIGRTFNCETFGFVC